MKKGSAISGRPHGSEHRKPHSRARLRDLERKWLRARPSRSALACGRAGNPGGIDGPARRQTGPEKEATVACTFEDRQNARGRRLTPQSTARLHRPRTLLHPNGEPTACHVGRSGAMCGECPRRHGGAAVCVAAAKNVRSALLYSRQIVARINPKSARSCNVTG